MVATERPNSLATFFSGMRFFRRQLRNAVAKLARMSQCGFVSGGTAKTYRTFASQTRPVILQVHDGPMWLDGSAPWSDLLRKRRFLAQDFTCEAGQIHCQAMSRKGQTRSDGITLTDQLQLGNCGSGDVAAGDLVGEDATVGQS